MARYNTIATTSSVAGGSTISTPSAGLLTTLTGSGTVTIPNPILYTGQQQSFYNSTGSAITLSASPAYIIGPGIAANATSISLPASSIITLVSDGTNYETLNWVGGPLSNTSATFSGTVTANSTVTMNPSNANISIQPTGTGTVTINPATAGTITNMSASLTSASLSSTTASTAYTNGALTVAGGVGIGGVTYTNGKMFVNGATSNQQALNVLSGIAVMDSAQNYLTTVVSNANQSVIQAYSGSGQGLAFQTTASGGSAQTNMVISSTGSVGIGTTGPSGKLDVVDGGVYTFRTQQISVSGSPNLGTYNGYLLLAKAYTTGNVAQSWVTGTFYLKRGSTGSGNRTDVYVVSSNTAYQSEDLTVQVQGNAASFITRTVKVTYNSVVYHAIETTSTGGNPDNGVWFTGTYFNCSPIYVDSTYVSSITAFTSAVQVLNSNGSLMVGSGPNNGQAFLLGVYKPATQTNILVNADNGYNAWIDFSAYSGGYGIGRNGGNGNLEFHTAVGFGGSAAVTMNSSGSVGIGTNSPTNLLTVNGTGTLATTFQGRITNGTQNLALGANSTAAEVQSQGSVPLYLNYGGNNVCIVANGSGNVGIGTNNPSYRLHVISGTAGSPGALYGNGSFSNYQRGIGTNSTFVVTGANSTDSDGHAGLLQIGNNYTSVTPSSSNPYYGSIEFLGTESGKSNGNASSKAIIAAYVSGSGGSTSGYGADLVFYTKPDNGTPSFSNERMRITSSGNVGIRTTSPTTYLDVNPDSISYGYGGYVRFGRNCGTTSGAAVISVEQSGSASSEDFNLNALSTSYTSSSINGWGQFRILNNTSRSTVWNHATFQCGSGNVNQYFRGDGNAYAHASWNSSGVDYAEYFESTDGSVIPVGTTVVLVDDKVRAATSNDNQQDILGVVRPKTMSKGPSVIGGGAQMAWQGKYLTDDFGQYIMEPYSSYEWSEEVTDSDGNTSSRQYDYISDQIPEGVVVPPTATLKTTDINGVPLMREKLNPEYDPTKAYEARESRPEWHIIGLLGQIPMIKGQPVGDRWRKMKTISDTVEMWYIR